MPVIIKGMTMPESCEDCRCGAEDRELVVTDLFLVRHDECPLEEIIIGIDFANGEDMTGGI